MRSIGMPMHRARPESWRPQWRRYLALFQHRDDVLNLLNQFAQGPCEEFCDVVEQYGGHREWGRRLHAKIKNTSL